MFHPHFCHLFFGTHDRMIHAMALVAACKVEQDLQKARSEEQVRKEKEGPILIAHVLGDHRGWLGRRLSSAGTDMMPFRWLLDD